MAEETGAASAAAAAAAAAAASPAVGSDAVAAAAAADAAKRRLSVNLPYIPQVSEYVTRVIVMSHSDESYCRVASCAVACAFGVNCRMTRGLYECRACHMFES